MKIVVLNDGETYTNLEGCKVYELKDGIDPDEFIQASRDPESFTGTRWSVSRSVSQHLPTFRVSFDDGLTMDKLMETVLSVLPDAEFGEDNDGQVVIYTNLRQRGESIVPFS